MIFSSLQAKKLCELVIVSRQINAALEFSPESSQSGHSFKNADYNLDNNAKRHPACFTKSCIRNRGLQTQIKEG
jgi:hypothetical protein